MRASPLMLAIALGLGLPQASQDAEARQVPVTTAKAEARSTWIVVFDEAPAASFRGFEPGDALRPKLAATSPVATGAEKYDSRSLEARAYVDYLADLRRVRLDDASRALGRPLEPIYTYSHAMNGVALALSESEADELARQPGVRAVRPDFTRRLMTTNGPAWINADEIWNGSASGVARRGEGIIVGVIDSGVNRNHVAFGGAGFTNPLGTFRGFCTTTPAACNNKLIGLYDFTNGNNSGIADPVDTDGHGTHTAATAAGNAFGTGYTGVAPRANLIIYKGCPDDSCEGSALIRSIDQAVADGVDVVNYSIGGGLTDPWQTVGNAGYDDSEAFLVLREAGIVAAAAAGNDGPGPGTVSNPGNTPWVMTVAAATHDRNGANNADRLANFSARGPVFPASVLKPDVTAPGVQIISAGHTGTSTIAQLSGTSMATPHVAGAAALLKSVNPAMTADQLMSALSLTARPSVKLNNLVFANPHEQGAGMIDVAKAVRAGLYMDVPPNAFRNARGDVLTGNAHNLNLPSLTHGNCFVSCQFNRNFKLMPGAAPANYSIQASVTAGATLTPSIASFNASAGGTDVTFTLDVPPSLVDTWVYGEVILVNNSGDGRPNLRLPVTAYVGAFSDYNAAFDLVAVDTSFERGFVDLDLGSLLPLPDARFVTTDLVVPNLEVRDIPVDPTENEPFDNVASNYSTTLVLPPSPASGPVTYKVFTETAAPNNDIDLYVGRDNNANGLPDEAETLCSSLSPGSSERCELEIVSTGSQQTLWVMVQNYSGPGTNVEITSVVVPLVPGTNDSLVATGPGHLPAETDFKLRLAWDDASMLNGQKRFGFLRIQPDTGTSILDIPVRLTRTAAGFAPYALADGEVRSISLPAGAAHETLVFDVPANATSVSFRSQGSGAVSLYAARVDTPDGPLVANAPARGAPGVLSSTGAEADKTITVSGAGLQPGRWYVTPVNTGGAAATVDVSATVNTVSAPLVVKPGSYYAPARGGHGIFMYPAGSERAVLWYAYFQDQSPTWYYMQAPQPGNNGSWNTPIYRAAWNGTANHLVQVGNVVMTAISDSSFTMAYNLDGFTGIEKMDAFLTGCPSTGGNPIDASANWFDPARAGSGYSVQLNPNYEFIAAFIYDQLGVPRFLAAERGGAFNAGSTTLPLDQLRGFSPLGAYSAPVRTTVGTLDRIFSGNALTGISVDATFGNGVSGTWDVDDAVVPLGGTQGCP